jgi:hypothetical protein
MHLLAKDAPFVFTEECLQSFHTLKEVLVSTHVMQPPDWHLPLKSCVMPLIMLLELCARPVKG